MSRLPRGIDCYIEERKISGYLLNPGHPVGASKAKFFIGHGFGQGQPELLEAALIQHAQTRELVESEPQGWMGTKHVVECQMSLPDGVERCIRAVWMEEPNGKYRLVTAYPTRKILE